MRNRRYTMRKGPLVVYSEDSGIVRAFRNIPGVDVARVDRLNLLQVLNVASWLPVPWTPHIFTLKLVRWSMLWACGCATGLSFWHGLGGADSRLQFWD